MYCKKCGSVLRENTVYCDRCGTGANIKSKTKQTNVLAIIGIIVAGISIFLNFWGLVGIASVILSSMGLIQINKTGEKGKGMAITGISIGAFSILYGFLMIIVLI
ncbi:MAG: DUF4190 domain-containing protein [Ruminococcaceae bacterium]|nr:DUF4190 domain-containing protein [Oscillospiraceae bacterium]